MLVSADVEHGGTLWIWDGLSWGHVDRGRLVGLFFLFPLLLICLEALAGWRWLCGGYGWRGRQHVSLGETACLLGVCGVVDGHCLGR